MPCATQQEGTIVYHLNTLAAPLPHVDAFWLTRPLTGFELRHMELLKQLLSGCNNPHAVFLAYSKDLRNRIVRRDGKPRIKNGRLVAENWYYIVHQLNKLDCIAWPAMFTVGAFKYYTHLYLRRHAD